MKTVLCYGDSNTWGYNAADGQRYAREVRWPGVLQLELGADFHVIEEGLNGRTTVWDDPIEGHKSGKTYLIPCLETHKPLDLVLLMLGTNDLKHRFALTAFDIAAGAGTLVDMILTSRTGRGGAAPQVLLLAPAQVGPLSGDLGDMFVGALQKAPQLGLFYRRVAAQYGCACMDTAEFLTASPLDGIHLDIAAHRLLGERVSRQVKTLLT